MMTYIVRALLLAASIIVSRPVFSAAVARIVAVVGGDIITSYELDGRVSFARSLMKGAKPPAGMRERILDEMVSDRLRLAEAAKYGVKVDDAEIDETIGRMEKFYGAKIDKSSSWVRDQARADIAWNKFVFGYLRSLISVGDAEVDAVVEVYSTRKSYEYSLVPLLADGDRMASLLAAAKKIASCSGFKSFAKQSGAAGSGAEIKVADKDMNPVLASELAKSGPGGLAGPVENAGGPALFYVCSKKETGESPLPPPDRAKIRQDVLMGKLEAFSQRYFERLRSTAAIDIRE
jgi:peptidyl-prolyl cis-trans isomerase SurA